MSVIMNTMTQTALPPKTRISAEDPLAVDIFSKDLAVRLMEYGISEGSELVVVCIGTDRSTGDCLGPLVGSKMASSQGHNFVVYGTLDEPVHASNLNDKLNEISINHPRG
ncbi:hypothetical protein N752_24275 [Desulforamulus aquiferis]|nr:hypothetical protein N752_24275 [Desulforamulus aquiferis]